MLQNKVFKQTFGKCERCHKNEIKTMQMRCRHITSCFTCAKTYKDCPRCRLPLMGYLPIYATYCKPPETTSINNNNEAKTSECETDDGDDVSTGGQPEEPNRKNASDSEFDRNKILDGSINNHELAANDTAKKQDLRDELYDPNATRMLGTCCICLSYDATCFILSDSEKSDEEHCGHNLCVNCIIPINECPICRRNISTYLEVKGWAK